MTILDFDVVIAGGGMVGSALACALGREGFRVGLVESREPQRVWPQGEIDLRVSALSRASQNIMTNLGAWPRMAALHIYPYRRMEVWDAGSSGRISFDCARIGEPDLGHIVENRVTQLALWQEMEGIESIERFYPARAQDLDLKGHSLRLEDGRVLHAGLIVAADGRDSPIRGMAGIEAHGWSYDQHAVVATVTPAGDHCRTAWQRFLPTGPLAFLPVDDGRCSIVWSSSPEETARLSELEEIEFLRQLTKTSEEVLGEILAVGPRAVFPLRLQHALSYVLPGLALVGDAAHAIHPLAGQGVNLGLLDAATLAQCLVEGRNAGRQAGDIRDLRRYERSRKGNNIAMLAAMDTFKRLFSNHNPLLGLARGLGLNLADRIPLLNHCFMRQALGLEGERPPLAIRLRGMDL
ncbi:MAG: 2-octaprenyl-3-methyl-6-methoxy-1,4-benzoquinol hydroxylase [Gammaproteobacteria bacterium RIFOXYA12_FULL_61_12]|nr:MAG: 2-octaprenyl-3-methyl-6-methoxy-1,4-benzoquinol hydroxylase [Gammaproteobacteria bacterium RIFOXYA12_FULL_61_12]OGT90306.1 MAG: 2-octaprenyl-3-methyl-6-methoxy-1,4-benzoquinol hydroxylase [Gammaproteobacteria bacterium RIFOXYD12_FULL_61_37]